MAEVPLTTDVLVPLFKSLGYDQVVVHGGADEKGKDLLLWKTDNLGEIELHVAQVKLFKPTRIASNVRNLTNVVTQLIQAASSRVAYTDGTAYQPRRILLITPFEVDARTLESHFDTIKSLKDIYLSIVDGARLATLLLTKARHLVRALLGDHLDVADVIHASLNNDVLLRALESEGGRKIESFYTDIDFSMGNPAIKAFLSARFSPRDIRVSLGHHDWREFYSLSIRLKKSLGVSLCREDHDVIEASFAPQLSGWSERDSRRREIAERLPRLQNIVYDYAGRAVRSLRWVINNNDQPVNALEHQTEFRPFCESGVKRLESLIDVVMPGHRVVGAAATRASDKTVKAVSSYSRNDLKQLRRHLLEIPELAAWFKRSPQLLNEVETRAILNRDLFREKKSFIAVVEDACQYAQAALELHIEAVELGNEREPTCEVTIAGDSIASSILRERDEIKEGIKRINAKAMAKPQQAMFYKRCEETMLSAGRMFKIAPLRQALAPSAAQSAEDLSDFRLKTSVHSLLDAGINLFVLGEAGAGKTTSLQAYALHRNRGPKDLTLFIPLSRLQSFASGLSNVALGATDKLLTATAMYLTTNGADQSLESLIELVQHVGSVCLFDGVDEVIRTMPWVMEAIRGLAEKYPTTQVVASSRLSDDYILNVPFMSVTLLPFTNSQREQFIRGWFDAKNNAEAAARVIGHLAANPELSEIVRNPLLATVLCVLEEHRVPLPDSEVQLYEERMRLLLGDYDLHKGITRTASRSRDLMEVATAAAYLLHRSNRREASTEELSLMVRDALRSRMRAANIERAIDELKKPCDVLVPMAGDGTIGFGHLRYQEYLAARYIAENRVQLGLLSTQSWWRGTFFLLAKMATDVEWIIRELCEGGRAGLETYGRVLFAARPQDEHDRLKKILRRYLRESREGKWLD